MITYLPSTGEKKKIPTGRDDPMVRVESKQKKNEKTTSGN